MRVRLVGALVLAALLLFPAFAVASHNMGHRYYVTGRVIDANGNPVQQREFFIRLMDDDSVVSSVTGTTDCHGDFHSLRSREGPANENLARPNEDGYGEIEHFEARAGVYPEYSNFHFHSNHLSDRLKFQVTVANDTWTIGFDSKRRQTVDYHQTESTYTPSVGCGSNYDEFASTLTVRVFIANQDDMHGIERLSEVKRDVELTYEGVSKSNETNFFNEFDAWFNETTVEEGKRVQLRGEEIGEKSLRLGSKEAKFHRVDSVNVVGLNAGGVLDDLKYVGIGIVVIAILVGLYMGGNRLRDKMAEKRLRETSTRRRFRRDKPE